MGVIQAPFAAHVTLTGVGAPASSTRFSGVLRVAPAPLFQWVWATTPALSPGPTGVALLPLNLIPIEAGGGPEGTIWIAFTGARRVPVTGRVGVAVKVKPDPRTVNFR